MPTAVGFVVLSHNNPPQLLRLVRRLVSMFDGPRVVCHHDLEQSHLQDLPFPPEVRFVKPHLATRWGDISLVQAFLRALEVLYEGSGPDWFVMLSAADYPVKSAPEIIAELQSSAYDAYLDYRLLENIPSASVSGADHEFGSTAWMRYAYDQYVSRTLDIPWLTGGLVPTRKKIRIRAPYPLRLLGGPFTRRFRCYAGDQWFSGNRETARILLRESSKKRELLAYYANKRVPDESFYQTMLCNEPALRICADNKRYSDWSGGGAHPKVLGRSDIPALMKSGAHFARKFDVAYDPDVLDELDHHLDNPR